MTVESSTVSVFIYQSNTLLCSNSARTNKTVLGQSFLNRDGTTIMHTRCDRRREAAVTARHRARPEKARTRLLLAPMTFRPSPLSPICVSLFTRRFSLKFSFFFSSPPTYPPFSARSPSERCATRPPSSFETTVCPK